MLSTAGWGLRSRCLDRVSFLNLLCRPLAHSAPQKPEHKLEVIDVRRKRERAEAGKGENACDEQRGCNAIIRH